MMFRRELLAAAGATTPSDPYFENVTLLLHGDGTNGGQNNTFIDSSSNNFTITRNGNVTQGSFSPYGNLWSNYFDGTGDYLTSAASSNLSIGSGDFTIECWAYMQNSASYVPTFFVQNASFSDRIGFFADTDNWYINGTPGFNDTSTGVSVALNTWTHLAISRSGSTVRAFINGVLTNTITNSTNYSTDRCVIGYIPSTNTYLKGYISNVRVIKGTAVYTANFTPPTSPLTAITNTSLLTCQSNRFIDNSSNNFAITRTGDVSVQRFSPFAPTSAYNTVTISGSTYLENTGADYLSSPSTTDFAFGTGDWTIECWIYPTEYLANMRIWDFSDDKDNADINVSTAGSLNYWNGTSSTTSSGGLVGINTWTHIAMVRSSGTVRGYVNGVEVLSQSTTPNTTSARSIRIGGSYSAPLFKGFISNFRVVKGTAVYTSNFTPSTTPVTAITNTVLLCNFTNGAIFDNAMMNDLETVGNAQISTSVKKYGTGSIYTPTSAYLINQNANINLGSANFTIEFWLNSSSDEGGYPGLVAVDSGLTGDYAGLVITKAGVFVTFNGSSWGIFAASLGTINDGTWRHIAVVRSGASLYCFNNGVLQSTTSIASAIFDKGPALIVGKKADNFNTGTSYIDDIRITNGIARYTSNFTPPSAAFPNT